MKVPFHGKAQPSSDPLDLGKAHIPQLGRIEAKIAESEQPVWFVWVTLCDQPGRGGIRSEQLDDGEMVPFAGQCIDQETNPIFDGEQIDLNDANPPRPRRC